MRRRRDPPHRSGRRRVPRCRWPGAQGRLELRRRFRQRRRGGLHGPRRGGRQHARSPDRDHRRPGVRPPDGRRSPRARGRSLRSGRQMEDLGSFAPPRAGRARGDHRHRRVRSDRPGRRAAGHGLRDDDPLPGRAPGGPGGRGGVRRHVPAARGAVAAIGLRVAPREPDTAVEGPDRRREAVVDEAFGRAGEHDTRAGHRPRRPGRCIDERTDLRGGARCHRPGAHSTDRSARRPRELPDRAAYRLGVARDAQQDGRDGGREPPRRRPRRAHPYPCQSRGLRQDQTAWPNTRSARWNRPTVPRSTS
jgi:hypothetical protein